ncbi:sigmaY antisigma factor component [Paenibacillus sp. FSL H8-0548]|uniref:sigmaY antisigma factor component n=1 Tax=Paenibacillus sp. FSL H8-0548 TaxID=1920422 RepID=UPI00096C9222|nr:sigmaY antisigma factor component [Paenibacillus sp. FSL H8-0548]OMF34726.1 sigmaY antisigma factor component [Paenibacillus sp. FSL H8-0548]
MEELKVLPLWFWILMIPILIAQSTWLFIDARKRDSMPWLWGLWGLIQTPLPLVFYYIFVRSGWFPRGGNKRKKQ